ncbi:MAG: putative membrane protein YfcA [Flavobacteriales bacterium]|jgi:uncharacterized membrane protein YfcA
MPDFILDLAGWQLGAIAAIFAWSGFVRSGLGFGGALLSIPFILLIDNRPLIYLPIIAVQLLVFATLTFVQEHQTRTHALQISTAVDWKFLKRALAIMIVPKLIGVFGLITLPSYIMSAIIFCIVSIYGLSYLFAKPFKSNNQYIDALFLVLGAYISGTSLIGAPLIVAVFACHVAKDQLRLTVFILWMILVTIKLTAFIANGVDLQLIQNIWLLPAAAVGHFIGMHFHAQILHRDTSVFYRWLGSALLLASIAGLFKELHVW